MTVIKVFLVSGLTLLLGADALRLYLAPGLGVKPRLWAVGLGLGALLVLGSSLAEVVLTLEAVLGRVPWARLPSYFATTQHGRTVLLRCGLVLLLLLARRLPLERFTLPALGLLLLVSASWTSHAGASGSALLLAADVLHRLMAVLWIGSLTYLAWLPVWHEKEALRRGLERLSALGLVYVGLLALTGSYAALFHLGSPAELTATTYGRVLLVKLAAVALAVGLAALNRWRFLPKLRRGGSQKALRTWMRLESLALLLVLLATGALSSTAPP